jgi:hypothetical protein
MRPLSDSNPGPGLKNNRSVKLMRGPLDEGEIAQQALQFTALRCSIAVPKCDDLLADAQCYSGVTDGGSVRWMAYNTSTRLYRLDWWFIALANVEGFHRVSLGIHAIFLATLSLLQWVFMTLKCEDCGVLHNTLKF